MAVKKGPPPLGAAFSSPVNAVWCIGIGRGKVIHLSPGSAVQLFSLSVARSAREICVCSKFHLHDWELTDFQEKLLESRQTPNKR
jgi:hypothetical protein